MNWIDIPTEQTTAVTDLVLAALAIYCIALLERDGKEYPAKKRIWIWGLGLLALAAFLGFVAHGFMMSAETNANIWRIIYLALGQVIAFFVIGVVYDYWGDSVSRRAAPVMVVVGLAFYFVTELFPGTFLVFIFYEAVALLFAMGIYVVLARRGELPGAWLMAAGILANIIAAAVQATETVSFTLIWPFDHNSVFHFIQMLGVWLVVSGLRRSFAKPQEV